MNDHHDIAVLGGGIVGVSTACHLLQRGFKVLLIDRGQPERATSFGNSGVIETSYVLPFSLPSFKRFPAILLNRDAAVHLHYLHLPFVAGWIADFYRKSQAAPRRVNGKLARPLVAGALDEHRALMRGTGAEKYLSSHGRVKLHRSAASFDGAVMEREVARDMGVPFDVMDAQEFTQVEPHLKPVYHKAVRWTESARVTNPGALVAAYTEKFVREGGMVLETEIAGMHPTESGAWHIHTQHGNVNVPQVVLCTGPWAGDFYKPLGYRFPLGIKRGYHQHFAALGGATLSHALVDADVGYLICPMEQGYRLTTGAEFAAIDAPATPVQVAQILPHARELFAIGEAVESRAWLGSRPCFTDSLPVVGAAPRHKNLWFNFGHGHSGLTIGPSSGRLLAEMIKGEKPFCDPAPYRAERFSA